MTKRGIAASSQFPVTVYYDGKMMGEYFADIFIEESLIIEIKAVRTLLPEHERSC